MEFHTQERRMNCLPRQSPVTGAIVPPSMVLCPLGPRPVVQALREKCQPENLGGLAAGLSTCTPLGCRACGCLRDPANTRKNGRLPSLATSMDRKDVGSGIRRFYDP